MRSLSELFKDAFKECNVFSASVSLRYDLDPDYNTFTGAFVTVGLMVLLVSVFYSQWIALLNRQAISSTTQVIREFDPVYMNENSDNFMFALGIEGLNLSDSTSFFDLTMRFYNVTNTPKYKKVSTYLTLQPCTVHHWQQLGEAFVQTYNRERLSDFMCPPRNLSIQLQGKFTSENFLYYKIAVNKCTKNCRPQADFDAWVAANGTFSFNFYFANTLLNPDQVQPITTFFQDKQYTVFSTTLYTQTNIYVRDYLMETDNSIFPWTDPQDVTGFVVDLAEKQDFVITAGAGYSYAAMYIRKSDTSLQISRSFRKIDDMLSYIGGLFGIIVAAMGFILNYYHRCSYELEMAQNYFDYHNKKNKKEKIIQNVSENSQLGQSSPNFAANYKAQDTVEEDKQENEPEEVLEPKQFGFLDFLMHLLYIPLKKICGCRWKRMDIYEDSLEEIKYKLDISQLLNKMAFYDRSFNVLFDEHQLKLLYLQDKFNFQEVRQQREMLQMRHDIIANIFGMLSERKQPQQTPQEQKKSLHQIAQQRSHKRISTFMGQAINVFDIIPHAVTKQTQEFDSHDSLPEDIKYALKRLDQKIQKGDPVSIRIYNNLQYQILEAFQKSKMRKSKHRVAAKKPPSRRIKMPKKQDIKGDRVMVVNFANQESAYEMSSRGLN